MALRTVALLPTASGYLPELSLARLCLQRKGGGIMLGRLTRFIVDPPPTIGGWFLILTSIAIVLAAVVWNGGMQR